MRIQIKKIAVVLTITIGVLTSIIEASPLSIETIPLLLGTTYESELTDMLKKGDIKSFNDEKYGMLLKNKEYQFYSSTASPDSVFKFYRAILKAKSYDKNSIVDSQSLNANEATPVLYYEPGQGGVIFEWQKKESNGDISCFSMSMNNSVGYSTKVKAETVFFIIKTTYSAEASTDKITQDELRIPIYPASVFSTEKSYNGFGGFYYYVFITDDDVDTVAAFYSQKLGVTAIKSQTNSGGNGYLFRNFSTESSEDTLMVCENIEDGNVDITYMTVKMGE